MHDRRVLGWGWAAGSPVHVSACHWIKVAVRWKYVPKRRRLRSRAVLVVRRCRLRQKYLNVFVEAGSCLTGADFGGRRWIGGAGSSRRHGCHRRRRSRFFFFFAPCFPTLPGCFRGIPGKVWACMFTTWRLQDLPRDAEHRLKAKLGARAKKNISLA